MHVINIYYIYNINIYIYIYIYALSDGVYISIYSIRWQEQSKLYV